MYTVVGSNLDEVFTEMCILDLVPRPALETVDGNQCKLECYISWKVVPSGSMFVLHGTHGST